MEWDLTTWLIDKSAPLLKRLLWRGGLARDNWVPRLNHLFRNEVELLGPYRHEPIIHLEGALTPSLAHAALAEEQRSLLIADPKRSNDPNAILCSDPHWADDPVHFHVQCCDYATLRVLRDESINPRKQPRVLSANVLLICREAREIILHRRADWSDHLPGALHTIGGAYRPPSVDAREGDRQSLRRTAIREAGEESDVAFSLEESPMVLLRELQTGFIQLAYLGANISSKEARNLKPNIEGAPVRVGFDDLPRFLREERNWYPSGKAAILAWLALGAPNGGLL